VLRDALVKMRGDMQRLYDKYAVDGKLTRAEMTKYNRYASMERQMLKELSPAMRSTLADLRRLTPEEYEAAFFRAAWQVDTVSGLRLNWGQVNLPAVTAALENEFSLIARGQLLDNAKFAIRRALASGLATGKSYQQMSRDLTKAIDATYNQAKRIVRTEGQRAQMAGLKDSYAEAEKKGVQGNRVWDATLDGDTRPTHAALDQVPADENGQWQLAGVMIDQPADPALPPGEAINCRCNIRFEIEGYSPQLRRSREQGIIPAQNYESWVKEYGPPVKRR
jgi:hypothetical protein